MQRDERPEEYFRERKRKGEKKRDGTTLSSLLSAARLSSVILSAGSYPRNLFRIITTPRNDYPLKCYFVNDIFTVIGDICDALDVRAIHTAFIVRSAFSAIIKQVRDCRAVFGFAIF
jgi:hypothetical protein